jgi:hypothetical protein
MGRLIRKTLIICITLGFFILFYPLNLHAIELPLEFHGRGFLGKYLNSDTTRYNMDASIDIYCKMIKFKDFSFFARYRDDLDMAEQKGGVSLDPRYAHYYIVGGFEYLSRSFLLATYFVHDCVHDIDYDIEGTPVFNRFRFQFASAYFHPSHRLKPGPPFVRWSVELGYYPHWKYHGWDVNAGADYNYDLSLQTVFWVLRHRSFGFDINPIFSFTKGDTCIYHQHTVRLAGYYTENAKRLGLELSYNIWYNDPIKSPDKLWLLSIFVEF